METVTGIFKSRAQAEDAVKELHSLGIRNDHIALLTPAMDDADVENAVPTADSEQPGMGQAMGGAVGGAIGVAGGASLGAAAASLLIPGVGPVIAGGILGAAILGAGGTAAGVAAGGALEKELEAGLPHDELYLYEDALRNGRSVVIAFVKPEGAIYAAQSAMSGAGAESIDQLEKIGGSDCATPRRLNTPRQVGVSKRMRRITEVVLRTRCGNVRRKPVRLPTLNGAKRSSGVTTAAGVIKTTCGRNTKVERRAAEPGGAGGHSWPERDHHHLVCAHDVHPLR